MLPVRFCHLSDGTGFSDRQLAAARLAAASGRPEQTANALLDLADTLPDEPIAAGRCRLQASLALIDAGRLPLSWKTAQTAIAALTSAGAMQSREPAMRVAEWLALAAASIASGQVTAAISWSRTAAAAVCRQQTTSCHTSAPLKLLAADTFSVHGACLQLKADHAGACTSLSTAFRLHSDAGDLETAASDLLWLARSESLLNRPSDAKASVDLAVRLLQSVQGQPAYGRADQLLNSRIISGAAHQSVCRGSSHWN